jgi:hypothetical protein
MADCYIALVHFPVYNRHGAIVTTAVSNLDIHDIARVAKTCDIGRYYVKTPLKAQQDLVRKILGHWRTGYGATFNPARKEALELVDIACDIDECIAKVTAYAGKAPKVVVTGAALDGDLTTFGELKRMMEKNIEPYLLLFGTGSGLTQDVIRKGHVRLSPLTGKSHYNHLPVRCAVAMILDRLILNYE